MPVNKSLTKKLSCFLLTGVVCLFFYTASAQGGDTAKPQAKPVHYSSRPAKKAMLYAAICPGLGQIYNKKYWKLPILYAGLGTAIYFIAFNQHYYNYYSNILNQINANPSSSIYSASEVSSIIDYYHNDRDLSIIITAGIYLISIVDANVDAQLNGFNVSDDISVKFTPSLLPNPLTGSIAITPGFTLTKRF
jgi:hypothetical protein